MDIDKKREALLLLSLAAFAVRVVVVKVYFFF
jgi:hypothetical protein